MTDSRVFNDMLTSRGMPATAPARGRDDSGRFKGKRQSTEAGARERQPVKMPWVFLAPTMGLSRASHAMFVIASDHPDYTRLVKLNHGRYIRFVDGSYATGEMELARYVREKLRDGGMRGVTEDLTAFPLHCEYHLENGERCPWSTPTSTRRDRDALYLHFLNEHMSEMSDRAELVHPAGLSQGEAA